MGPRDHARRGTRGTNPRSTGRPGRPRWPVARGAFGLCGGRRGIAQAEQGLHLPEASRLEPGRGFQSIAEGQELQRRHRLEDIDLGDERLEDLEHPVEQVQGAVRVTCLEGPLDTTQLMADLLEPELVDLVDDDEQQLVVLSARAIRTARALDLEREQFRHLEVGRVRDGAAGHLPMVRPRTMSRDRATLPAPISS